MLQTKLNEHSAQAMTLLKNIYLKKYREKSVLNRHPWVYSGAIDRIDHGIEDGDMVFLRDFHGATLGTGYYNSSSRIRVRLLAFGGAPVDREFLRTLVSRAVEYRQLNPLLKITTACRLINGEGDGLPGLVVDQYDRHLVIQTSTRGIERIRETILELLMECCKPDSVYERSDQSGRALEGLKPRVGQVFGHTPDEIIISEYGTSYSVDVRHGQKTGFYLDQRENRELIRSLSPGKKLLNLFSYTGGFSLAAMAGGAVEAVSVDSSSEALERARANAALLLLSCSCSRFIGMDLFQKIVFSAMADAGRQATILKKSHHPVDHPVNIYCPETEYLKALLLRLD